MSWFWPSKKEIKQFGEELVKSASPETPVGRIVPVTPEPKPEPDLSTKSDDIVGYCFGFACPKKHVQNTFESVTVDGYKERRACNICGAVAKPCVVKRIAEATWMDCQRPGMMLYGSYTPAYRWNQFSTYDGITLWNRFEFFHYLETPKKRKK